MNRLILLLGCSLPLAFVVQAESGKQDYKCFIDSVKGEQVVFYHWKVDELAVKMAKLPGSQLADNKGKKYYIKSVVECVPLGEDFSDDKAKKLDKITLR